MPILSRVGTGLFLKSAGGGPPAEPGEAVFHADNSSQINTWDSTKVYNWTVPAGVYEISVVSIGGGGSGVSQHDGASGCGGGLAYKNNIAVTPGSTIEVSVGGGGGSAGSGNWAKKGEASFITYNGTQYAKAGGGNAHTAGQYGNGGIDNSLDGIPSGDFDGGGRGGRGTQWGGCRQSGGGAGGYSNLGAYGGGGGATSRSVAFDGSSDYLTVWDGTNFKMSGGTDFTIECWVKFNDSSSNQGVWQLEGFTTNYTTTLAFAHNGSNWHGYRGGSTWDFGGSRNANQWYHIAYVRNGSSAALYLDGSQLGNWSDSYNYQGETLAIGGYYTTGYLLNGNISNFRVVRGQALYTGSFTPTSQPLTTTSQGANANDVTLLCCNNVSVTGKTVGPSIQDYGPPTASSEQPFGGATNTTDATGGDSGNPTYSGATAGAGNQGAGGGGMSNNGSTPNYASGGGGTGMYGRGANGAAGGNGYSDEITPTGKGGSYDPWTYDTSGIFPTVGYVHQTGLRGYSADSSYSNYANAGTSAPTGTGTNGIDLLQGEANTRRYRRDLENQGNSSYTRPDGGFPGGGGGGGNGGRPCGYGGHGVVRIVWGTINDKKREFPTQGVNKTDEYPGLTGATIDVNGSQMMY